MSVKNFDSRLLYGHAPVKLVYQACKSSS